jgi:hypothetical protein
VPKLKISWKNVHDFVHCKDFEVGDRVRHWLHHNKGKVLKVNKVSILVKYDSDRIGLERSTPFDFMHWDCDQSKKRRKERLEKGLPEYYTREELAV